jgi:transposase
MEVLFKYPTPEKICRVNLETLTKIFLKHSNGYFGKAKAMELKAAAKTSFGVADTNGVYSDLIRNYIEMIRSTQAKIGVLDQKIKELMDSLASPITSITGIGVTLGAMILSEIGDISRFRSSDKLAAFAGIDPTVKQSGNFASTQNRMSKRGSPYLRRAIWMACTCAWQHDPMFHAYYDKKAGEGLRYMNIMGHLTKKMTAVIFAVLRDNKAYVPHLVPTN